MIVVSDTSPLRALHHLQLVPLLRTFFGNVLLPPAVDREIRTGSSHCPPFNPTSTYPFLVVRAPLTIDPRVRAEPELQVGEIEAISLALELNANTILLDEFEARRVAHQLGLRRVGVLGLLVDAKDAGEISAVAPLIQRLRSEIGFFVSEKLLREVLDLAGE